MRNGLRVHNSASMRLSYTSLAPANLRGRMREVSHFNAAEPGKGHGSELLASVCKEADKHGLALMILPTSERLINFYTRHGFEVIQADPAVMLRASRHVSERTLSSGHERERPRQIQDDC